MDFFRFQNFICLRKESFHFLCLKVVYCYAPVHLSIFLVAFSCPLYSYLTPCPAFFKSIFLHTCTHEEPRFQLPGTTRSMFLLKGGEGAGQVVCPKYKYPYVFVLSVFLESLVLFWKYFDVCVH